MIRSETDARNRSLLERSVIGVLFVATAISVGTGCGRPFKTAELPAKTFASGSPRIDARVEVCLTPELRSRTWNVQEHPFRVGLGERMALNFERMAKAAFRETITTFDAECGRIHSLPWITARIDGANRELDSAVYRDQITVVTITSELFAASGESIWRETTVGETIADPSWFFRRHTAAARDMGDAIGKALDLAYASLMESKAIRRALAPSREASP